MDESEQKKKLKRKLRNARYYAKVRARTTVEGTSVDFVSTGSVEYDEHVVVEQISESRTPGSSIVPSDDVQDYCDSEDQEEGEWVQRESESPNILQMGQDEREELQRDLESPDILQEIEQNEEPEQYRDEKSLGFLAAYLSNQLTKKAAQDMLTLCDMPFTLYSFFLQFRKEIDQIVYWPFCTKCGLLMEELCTSMKTFNCPKCKDELTIAEAKRSKQAVSFFSMKYQLEAILGMAKVQESYGCLRGSSVSDVINSSGYRTLVEPLRSDACEMVSLILFWDGLQVFNSGKTSAWPILLQIAEIPPFLRRRFQLISSAYLGQQKPPDLQQFYRRFLEELKELSTDGFTVKGKRYKTNLLLVCADSQARPMVHSTLACTGGYGCTFCPKKAPFEFGSSYYVEKLDDGNYNWKKERQRTEIEREFVLSEAQFASQQRVSPRDLREIMKGYGPKSPIDAVKEFQPQFDVFGQSVPDYMHGVCLGVVKFFLKAMFESEVKFSSLPCNIRPKRDSFLKKLIEVRPPSEITRLCKTLEDIDAKASTLKHFILYYIHLLDDLLPRGIYKQFAKLSRAMHILLSETLTEDLLDEAELCIEQFVEKLCGYGSESDVVPLFKFNTHMLLHLVDFARRWNGLWSTSAFSFESYVSTIQSYVKGPTYPLDQISKKIVYLNTLRREMDSIKTEKYLKLVETATGHIIRNRVSNAKEVGSVFLIGAEDTSTITPEDYVSFMSLKDFHEGSYEYGISVSSFKRAMVNNVYITTTDYTRTERRNDSVIILRSNAVAVALKILLYGSKVLFVGELFGYRTTGAAQRISVEEKTVIERIQEEPELICFLGDEVCGKCVLISKDKCIPIPNRYERD